MTCLRFITHHDLAGLTVKYKNFTANNDAVLSMKRNEEGRVQQAPIHPSQPLLKLGTAWPEAADRHLSPSEMGDGQAAQARAVTLFCICKANIILVPYDPTDQTGANLFIKSLT